MSIKVIASNRKARHNYAISDTWEAGISLQGTEVKALRQGKANLSDGWVDIAEGEAFLKEVHISPYSHGNRENHPEKRTRKLLLHKKEIHKMERAVNEKGFALVPLKLYFKHGKIKAEIGLGKGKKFYDKRESKKKQDSDRDMQRAMRRS